MDENVNESEEEVQTAEEAPAHLKSPDEGSDKTERDNSPEALEKKVDEINSYNGSIYKLAYGTSS